jgi:hypothetical protein
VILCFHLFLIAPIHSLLSLALSFPLLPSPTFSLARRSSLSALSCRRSVATYSHTYCLLVSRVREICCSCFLSAVPCCSSPAPCCVRCALLIESAVVLFCTPWPSTQLSNTIILKSITTFTINWAKGMVVSYSSRCIHPSLYRSIVYCLLACSMLLNNHHSPYWSRATSLCCCTLIYPCSIPCF